MPLPYHDSETMAAIASCTPSQQLVPKCSWAAARQLRVASMHAVIQGALQFSDMWKHARILVADRTCQIQAV